MERKTKQMATCGMMVAVCVIIMLLGSVLELGIYAAPMFAGLCLVPLGETWGRKYQILLWISISILSFLLVPSIEENLMFAGLFGPYPILRPSIEKLPKGLRLPAKLVCFNVVVILIESLLLFLLVPESLEGTFLILLLILGNGIFLLYDHIIPRSGPMLKRIFRR